MSVQRVEELWQMKAACRGPQATIFFPPAQFERKDEKEARESRAKSICVPPTSQRNACSSTAGSAAGPVGAAVQ